MQGTNVLLVLAVTNFVHQQATSASDGNLICPTAWTGTVTLVCEVAFSSLSKCTYNNKSTSFFEVERNNIKTTSCSVSEAQFASCSFTPGSATGCGCTKTGTHFRFIYQITNAENANYTGAWGCTKSCFDNNGNNALEITKAEGCMNVGGSGDPDGDGAGSDGLSGGEIAGISVGVFILVGLIGGLFWAVKQGKGPFKKKSACAYSAPSSV